MYLLYQVRTAVLQSPDAHPSFSFVPSPMIAELAIRFYPSRKDVVRLCIQQNRLAQLHRGVCLPRVDDTSSPPSTRRCRKLPRRKASIATTSCKLDGVIAWRARLMRWRSMWHWKRARAYDSLRVCLADGWAVWAVQHPNTTFHGAPQENAYGYINPQCFACDLQRASSSDSGGGAVKHLIC